MRNKRSIIILSLLLGLIFISGLLTYGLYSMDIEDHYGELQNFHFESKNGDLINRPKNRPN